MMDSFLLLFQNILDKFNPGARQLINAGKAYLKALHGEWIKSSVPNRSEKKRDRNSASRKRRPVRKERRELCASPLGPVAGSNCQLVSITSFCPAFADFCLSSALRRWFILHGNIGELMICLGLHTLLFNQDPINCVEHFRPMILNILDAAMDIKLKSMK